MAMLTLMISGQYVGKLSDICKFVFHRSDILVRMSRGNISIGAMYFSDTGRCLLCGCLRSVFGKFGIGADPGFAGVLLYAKVSWGSNKGRANSV